LGGVITINGLSRGAPSRVYNPKRSIGSFSRRKEEDYLKRGSELFLVKKAIGSANQKGNELRVTTNMKKSNTRQA
jgi:hypothetical protein